MSYRVRSGDKRTPCNRVAGAPVSAATADLAAQKVASLDGWLFTAPRGGHIRYDNWRTRTWNRVVEAAGVGKVHPHDLRHTLATRLFLVDRWTVPQVQAHLGHAALTPAWWRR